MTTILEYLAALLAVVFVLAPHEFAHAYVAYKCGDATAKMRGRMTLNPIKHLDPVGFIMCAAVGFGWAKPVPINPYNFRNYRRGLFLTAIAGVVTNYIIAFIGYMLFLVVHSFVPSSGNVFYVYYLLINFTGYLYLFNLGVFMFNLLPLFPLDGFRVVESLTREINPVRRFLRTYGQYILIILVLESFLCGLLERYTSITIVKYFDILGYVQWFANNILGYPIKLVWDTIFGLGIPTIAPY